MSTDASPPPTTPPRHHFSLRELFLLIAWAAIGCAALKTANATWWTVLSTIMILLVMGMGIVATVDRGRKQAFAQGFLICVIIYVGLTVMVGRELNPHEGTLPTTRSMAPLFQAMVKVTWYDSKAGTIIAEPSEDAKNLGAMGWGPMVYSMESPDRTHFMRVAHTFWALLLGYVGGRFAQVVYRRRQIANPPAPVPLRPHER